jgi:integrase
MATRNLTAKAVKAFTYDTNGPSRQVLWDQKVTGFGVRVYPSNQKSFVINYRVGRRMPLMSLGKVNDYDNVTQGREKAAEHLRLVRREGIDPLTERRRQRAAGTLKDLFEQWLAACAIKCAPRTVKDYKYYVKRYLLPALGTFRPQDLTRSESRRILVKLTDNHGPVTANRVVKALRGCYVWALKQDSATFPPGFANPVVVEWNRESSRKEHIRPQELPALTSAIEADSDRWARAYLWLLLLTGARGGEILKLKWSDVSLDSGEIHLRGTKNGSDFRMKLSGAAIDVLRNIPGSGDYVFPAQRNDGNAPHMGKPRAAWKRILRRAGIDRHVTLHDLRRSAGVLLSARGFTAQQIAKQLNHRSDITARIYVQIADEIQQRMADVLGSAAKGSKDASKIPAPIALARRDTARAQR